jgi:hypothetical protein
MAGLEVVVRPVVFPNIRPTPARSLPPADDPDKGFATIRGQGAKQVDLSMSFSSSTSTSQRNETKRRVDEARVYQKEDDGTVNKDNFVDVDVANRIWMKGPPKDFVGFTGDDVGKTVPGRGYTGDDIEVHNYQPVKKKDNIEIKKKNTIKKAEGQ